MAKSSEYGGINMQLAKGNGGMGGNKSSPRMGAAKGQGAGLGGYNASAVKKAMGSIVGAAVPSYSSGAGECRNMK
jgi:hypothetical protein